HIITTRPERDWVPRGYRDEGPARVRIEVRGGDVRDLDIHVGGEWRDIDAARDLGDVPAEEAATFFLTLARNGRAGVAEDAVFPATIARGVDPWPAILGLARDRTRPEDVRESAMFWIGQEAGQKVAAELESVVNDSSEDVELRKKAVFALTQRPDPECVPILLRLARTHPDPEVRGAVFFWLAQKDDPRVLDLFEEILLGG
ncbi:MAG: HEAT repeat domain-containing protein, partial [Candidatus Eisenbacteria bacterium]|nr:HEAT repeat domain-containing protein [Candidatus Eisenbacteria bacterium]